MTQEEFEEWIEVTVPSALFHVPPEAIDDEHGGRLDETILVRLIAENPGVLRYKSLHWLTNHFLKIA